MSDIQNEKEQVAQEVRRHHKQRNQTLCIEVEQTLELVSCPHVRVGDVTARLLSVWHVASAHCLLQKFGKSFDELEGRERQSVGGTVGGSHR